MRRQDLASRFWSKVDKSDPEGCWNWTAAARNRSGYGLINIDGKQVLAHRAAWEMSIGPIPEGLELDHLCRNPSCVNPRHLEPVTHAENVLRGTSPAARHARQTHCVAGHAFDEANTWLYVRGQRRNRVCRACDRDQARNSRQRARSALTTTRDLAAVDRIPEWDALTFGGSR